MSNNPDTYDQTGRLERYARPTASSPFQWLRAGLRDMIRSPATSVTLGLAFTSLCLLGYLAVSSMPTFSAAVLAMLLLTAPFLAAAAYQVPLQREQGGRPGISACLIGVRKRLLDIGLFAIVCAMIVAAWTRLAGIAFALYYGTVASGPEIARIWTSGTQSLSMLVFLGAASALLAFVLFAVSAVSLPMIAARNTDFVTAMRTSIGTLGTHKLALAIWGLLIVATTSAALASKLILMPLIFPLLAYATWHSYRQLVYGGTQQAAFR